MSKRKIRFSPAAKSQLDAVWDYGYRHFGERQADEYLDDLFAVIDEVAETGLFLGTSLKQIPPDKTADITPHSVQFIRFKKHYLYMRTLSDGALGIICILGDRMDTPRRLQEQLAAPTTDME